MKRGEAMDTAKGYITKDRQQTHGRPEDTFGDIAKYWSTYLGMTLLPHDVAALMALLKIARIGSNPFHEDNWVDGAGYMGCGVELATEISPQELDKASEAIEYELVEREKEENPILTINVPEEITLDSKNSFAKTYTNPSNDITVNYYSSSGVRDVEKVTISDEHLDQFERAVERENKKKADFYKRVYEKWPFLPLPNKMIEYHLNEKDGEITHEPRWFISVLAREPFDRRVYRTYYLHGYQEWVED